MIHYLASSVLVWNVTSRAAETSTQRQDDVERIEVCLLEMWIWRNTENHVDRRNTEVLYCCWTVIYTTRES